MNFPRLNFPAYSFKLSREDDTVYVFDEIRKKKIRLSPEEWVRQHVVQYLIQEKNIPKGLIKLESGLRLHGKQKRSDILVYDRNTQPVLLAECKAPQISIDEKVFEQAIRYNFIHRVPYILLSNGIAHYLCRMDYEEGNWEYCDLETWEMA